MPFTAASHRGILHHFAPRLFAFEHASPQQQSPQQPPPHHTLLFLGGLGDDLLHPSYPSKLPRMLPADWTVAELHLSSSGAGWTTTTLARDADELAAAVAHFRSLPGRGGAHARVALLGHSTGAQVAMEYLTQAPAAGARWPAPRPRLDAVVLQAGVSDREGLAADWGAEGLRRALGAARDLVDAGRGDDVLARDVTRGALGASPTAQRFVSLASVGGGDDYFSSDLGLEAFRRTFGKVGVPMLCLLSGDDEHMPSGVDKEALLGMWREAVVGAGGVWSEESGVVKGAGHNLNKSNVSVVEDLAGRVSRFLAGIKASGGKEERL